MSSLPVSASLTIAIPRPPLAPVSIHTQTQVPEDFVLKSLRQDVHAHPDEFITFETGASANRFLAEHSLEAERETNPRVIARGILGYCAGKLLVVLPSLSATTTR